MKSKHTIRKGHWILLFAIGMCNSLSNAQPTNKVMSKVVSDAYLITRMASKFHIQPRKVNDSFSIDVYNKFLEELDASRIFFTSEDMKQLEPYRLQIDEQILQKKTDFLQLIIYIYLQRISEVDTMTKIICKAPFDFTLNENISLSEDTSWADNSAEIKNKLYKRLKLNALTALVYKEDTVLENSLQKKYLDSIEPIIRKRTQRLFSRYASNILMNPQEAVGRIYCKVIASCYDPHTDYFPLIEKQNFEDKVSAQCYQFGFELDNGQKGGVVIAALQPGGAAFKSGLVNSGDKIVSMQWQREKVIDVSDEEIEEVNRLLALHNDGTLILSIKKANGSIRQVILQKEKQTDESSKVKSFVLKGVNSIGYILLPSFYTDWNTESQRAYDCANDVAKEIIKLSKENIKGLILDLRFNGGGSIEEAVELSGLFIDAGPVAQIKTKDKVYVLKDVNRGTVYNGPLLILVNSHSASASEMVAGTLQDYNRALIVGSSTYGKATAQSILPLDTTIQPEKRGNTQVSDYIKLTTEKLYRITGATIQGKGVQPDIELPDLLEIEVYREATAAFALQIAPIEANKYYKPYTVISSAFSKEAAVMNISYFTQVENYIESYKRLQHPQHITLQFNEAMKQKKHDAILSSTYSLDNLSPIKEYIVDNNEYEKNQLNAEQQKTNNTLKNYLQKDPYLQVAYSALLKM